MELEEQKTYLTEEQVKQTDSEIGRVQREISSYETAIADMDKQEDGLQEKKKKLIERHRQSATLNEPK